MTLNHPETRALRGSRYTRLVPTIKPSKRLAEPQAEGLVWTASLDLGAVGTTAVPVIAAKAINIA